jgi:hypothetical protein
MRSLKTSGFNPAESEKEMPIPKKAARNAGNRGGARGNARVSRGRGLGSGEGEGSNMDPLALTKGGNTGNSLSVGGTTYTAGDIAVRVGGGLVSKGADFVRHIAADAFTDSRRNRS